MDNHIHKGPTGPDTNEQERLKKDMEFAVNLILDAGEVAKKIMATDYNTIWKPDNTPVTEIDTEINRIVIEKIKEHYPEDSVLGEEDSAEGKSGFTWVLDPIDGTQSLGMVPTAMICLARVDGDGKAIFSVMLNPDNGDLFTADRVNGAVLNGERLSVSSKVEVKGSYVYFGSGLKFEGIATNGVAYDRLEGKGAKILNTRSLAFGACMVASGRAQGSYIGVKTPFEIASVSLLVELAGGKVTDLYGNPIERVDENIKGAVISNGHLHQELLDAIRLTA